MIKSALSPEESAIYFKSLFLDFKDSLTRDLVPPTNQDTYIARILKHFAQLSAANADETRIQHDLRGLWDAMAETVTALDETEINAPLRGVRELRKRWNHFGMLARRLRSVDELLHPSKLQPVRNGRIVCTELQDSWVSRAGSKDKVDVWTSTFNGMRVTDISSAVAVFKHDTQFIAMVEREIFEREPTHTSTYEAFNLFAALSTSHSDRDFKGNSEGIRLAMKVLRYTFEEEGKLLRRDDPRENSLSLQGLNSSNTSYTSSRNVSTNLIYAITNTWIEVQGLNLLFEAAAPTSDQSDGVELGTLAQVNGITSWQMSRARWDFWKNRISTIQVKCRDGNIDQFSEYVLQAMQAVEREYACIFRMRQAKEKQWGCAIM